MYVSRTIYDFTSDFIIVFLFSRDLCEIAITKNIYMEIETFDPISHHGIRLRGNAINSISFIS